MLYSLFENIAEREGNRTALFYNGNEVSFSTFRQQANVLSDRIYEGRTIEHGSVVTLLIKEVNTFLIAVIGLSKLGLIPRPVFNAASSGISGSCVVLTTEDITDIPGFSFTGKLDTGISIFVNNGEAEAARYQHTSYICRGCYRCHDEERSLYQDNYLQYIKWLSVAAEVSDNTLCAFDFVDPDRIMRVTLPFLLCGSQVCHIDPVNMKIKEDPLFHRATHICYSPGNRELLFEAVGSSSSPLCVKYLISFWDYACFPEADRLYALLDRSNDFKGELKIYGKLLHSMAGASRLYTVHLPLSRKNIGFPIYDGSIAVVDNHDSKLSPGIVGNIQQEEMRLQEDLNPRGRSRNDKGRYTSDGAIEITRSSPDEFIADGEAIRIARLEKLMTTALAIRGCRVLMHNDEFNNQQIAVFIMSGSASLELAYIQERLQSVIAKPFLERMLFIPIFEDHWQYVINETNTPGAGLLPLTFIKAIKGVIGKFRGIIKEHAMVYSMPEVGGFVEYSVSLAERRPAGIRSIAEASVTPALAEGDKIIMGGHGTLIDAFLSSASQLTKGIRFISPRREEFLSYYELLKEAGAKLNGLRELGFKKDDTVIFQVGDLKDFIVLFWACLLGGIVPVVMPTVPDYGKDTSLLDKLLGVWEFLGKPGIFAGTNLAEPLRALGKHRSLDGFSVTAYNDIGIAKALVSPDKTITGGDTAFILLTSGSTGRPKCVPLTHENALAHIAGISQCSNYNANDIIVNILPIEHITPLLTLHIRSVLLGAQQVHIEADLFISEPHVWFETLEKYRGTYTFSPNFAYKLIVERALKTNEKWDVSSVKYFKCAGEMLSYGVIDNFVALIERCGGHSQQFQPIYGMTELAGAVTFVKDFTLEDNFYAIARDGTSGHEREQACFCDVGKPIPGVSVRIVNRENKLLSEGQIGRIQVRGKVGTPGYLKNEQANEAAFTGDGWFNTGDLGFLINGSLVVTGRENDTIIINAIKYYCHEFEELIRKVKGVEKNCVAVCPKREVAKGTEALIIFFTPVSENRKDIRDTIDRIRQLVNTRFGIQPRQILPVKQAVFSRTDSGKINRSSLSNHYEEGTLPVLEQEKEVVPSADLRTKQPHQRLTVYFTGTLDKEFLQDINKIVGVHPFAKHYLEIKQTPAIPTNGGGRIALDQLDNSNYTNIIEGATTLTETESLLVGIWQDILNKPGLGIFDNFFALGGDSIKAIQIVNRLMEHDFKASVSDIFLYPSIATLYPNLQVKRSPKGNATGQVCLTPVQHLLFTRPDAPRYNQAVLLKTEGLSRLMLQHVFKKLQAHHDILQMGYAAGGRNETLQVMQRLNEDIYLEEFDYHQLPVEEGLEKMNNVARQFRESSIDLLKGHPFKTILFHLSSSDYLLIVAHVSIIDEASWRILLKDISILMRQYAQGQALSLHISPGSYQQAVAFLHEWAGSDGFRGQVPYWRQLEQYATGAALLADKEDHTIMDDRRYKRFSLSVSQTEHLLTDAQQAYNTDTRDLLLAALAISLKRMNGERQVLIEMEEDGREGIKEQIDLSHTMGNFTSVYPLLVRTETHSLHDQLIEIKEQLRKVPFKGIGYGALKYMSEPVYTWDLYPQVQFAYLGQPHTGIEEGGEEIAGYSFWDRNKAGLLPRSWRILACIMDGQLWVSLYYDQDQTASKADSFLHTYQQVLSEIITHCMQQDQRHVTPSDLTYKNLTIKQLHDLIDRLRI